jgi:hypothetical protein
VSLALARAAIARVPRPRSFKLHCGDARNATLSSPFILNIRFCSLFVRSVSKARSSSVDHCRPFFGSSSRTRSRGHHCVNCLTPFISCGGSLRNYFGPLEQTTGGDRNGRESGRNLSHRSRLLHSLIPRENLQVASISRSNDATSCRDCSAPWC